MKTKYFWRSKLMMKTAMKTILSSTHDHQDHLKNIKKPIHLPSQSSKKTKIISLVKALWEYRDCSKKIIHHCHVSTEEDDSQKDLKKRKASHHRHCPSLPSLHLTQENFSYQHYRHQPFSDFSSLTLVIRMKDRAESTSIGSSSPNALGSPVMSYQCHNLNELPVKSRFTNGNLTITSHSNEDLPRRLLIKSRTSTMEGQTNLVTHVFAKWRHWSPQR